MFNDAVRGVAAVAAAKEDFFQENDGESEILKLQLWRQKTYSLLARIPRKLVHLDAEGRSVKVAF